MTFENINRQAEIAIEMSSLCFESTFISDDVVTESVVESMGNLLRRIFEAVKNLILKVCQKIQEIIVTKNLEKTIDEAKEILKNNPKTKNIKIEWVNVDEMKHVIDTNQNNYNVFQSSLRKYDTAPDEEISDARETMLEDLAKIQESPKNMPVSAVINGVTYKDMIKSNMTFMTFIDVLNKTLDKLKEIYGVAQKPQNNGANDMYQDTLENRVKNHAHIAMASRSTDPANITYTIHQMAMYESDIIKNRMNVWRLEVANIARAITAIKASPKYKES